MGWTDRSDAEASCPGPGAVQQEERLARLLHSSFDPDGEAFPSSQLRAPKGVCHPNICGVSEGLSITREPSSDKIRVMADRLALGNPVKNRSVVLNLASGIENIATRQPPPRVGRGARVAAAKDVRGIRLKAALDEQIVFVYDDPTPADDKHAIMRAKEGASKAQLK